MAREALHVIVAPGNTAGAADMRQLRERADRSPLPAIALTNGEPADNLLAAGFQMQTAKDAGTSALARAIRQMVPRPTAA